MSNDRAAFRDTLVVALVVFLASLLYAGGYRVADTLLPPSAPYPTGQPGATPLSSAAAADLVPSPTPLGFHALPSTPPTERSGLTNWHERTLMELQPPECPRIGAC